MPPGRSLSLPHATALVVASMVGTGVFTATGFMLSQVRSPLIVLGMWAVAGALALFGAVVYAELGAMMPRAGGEYVYLSRAFHPAVGFLSGWLALLVGFAAPTAATALAFGRYLEALLPQVPAKAAALGLVALMTGVHARNVRGGGVAQTILTGLVVATIVVFIVAALASGNADWARLAAAADPTRAASGGALAVSLVYVSYSYLGWNAAVYVAGEIRDPQRALPRALIGGTMLVTALYVTLNAVFLAAAPPELLTGKLEVVHVAATSLFGGRGAAVAGLMVVLALAGSVSALAMTGPRVIQVMAEDGMFFLTLARKNRWGAPSAAVLLQGSLAAIGVLTATFEPLLVYAGFTLNLSAAATIAGAFVLRRREPDTARPYRALAWPWSGLVYLALTAFMTIFAVKERPLESLAGLTTLVAGGAAWFVWRRRRAPAGTPAAPKQT